MELKRRWLIPVAMAVVAGLGFVVWDVSDRYRGKVLTIATASKGGEYFAFAQSLAQVVERHHPQIRLRVVETKGSAENMKLLQSRQVELAIAQNDTPFQPAVQVVAPLFPEVFHLIVAPDSQIQSIPDLKGKRIALMPKGSGSYQFFWHLLQHYGLGEGDVQTLALPLAEAQAQFRQQKVDGLFRSIAPGNAGMRELIQATQARLISLDQALALQISQPFLQPIVIPKGLYRGNPPMPASDSPSVSVRALLLTHQDIDPELIYQITRILYDYRNELAALNPRAATIGPASEIDTLGLPLHPGAANYYNKNEPTFLERYAESMAFLITVAGIILSFLWQVRSQLTKKQKNRADAYNLKVLDLVERIASCQDLESLEGVRRQLFEIFKQVVQDLDEDRLTPEAFQSFAVSWQVTINSIHHREILILNQRGSTPHPLGSAERAVQPPAWPVTSDGGAG